MQFGATAESSIAKLRMDQAEAVSAKPSLPSSAAVGGVMRASSQQMRRTSATLGLGYQPPAKVCACVIYLA